MHGLGAISSQSKRTFFMGHAVEEGWYNFGCKDSSTIFAVLYKINCSLILNTITFFWYHVIGKDMEVLKNSN